MGNTEILLTFCSEKLRITHVADAATQTRPARVINGAASLALRGSEPNRLDLRIIPRPDGAKPHPETGQACADLPEKPNKPFDCRIANLPRIASFAIGEANMGNSAGRRPRTSAPRTPIAAENKQWEHHQIYAQVRHI